MTTYTPAASLDEIMAAAQDACANGAVFNLCLAYDLEISVLTSEFVATFESQAAAWMTTPGPPTLPFSHADYYRNGEGLRYVENQLKRNGTRRALLSLVGMDELISASVDKQIPSFLTLQFAIEDNELFLTGYYRALEVSTFLATNLTELCLHARWARERFPKLKRLKLVVFAFRAYAKEGFTLELAKIDMEQPGKVALAAQAGRFDQVRGWLEDKMGTKSQFQTGGLEELANGMAASPNAPEAAVRALRSSIIELKRLRSLRIAHTEGSEIEECEARFLYLMKSAIRALPAEAV